MKKIIEVCDDKIAKKGTNVGLSFYAFFANKPELGIKTVIQYASFRDYLRWSDLQ